METNIDLGDELQQQLLISGILAAKPELVKIYPDFENILKMAKEKTTEYLGNNDKMIFIMSKNGSTRLLVVDSKIEFTISNKLEFEYKGQNPVIKNYELNDVIQKLLSSSAVTTIRERYEKTKGEEEENNSGDSSNPLSSIMGMFKK